MEGAYYLVEFNVEPYKAYKIYRFILVGLIKLLKKMGGAQK
jgi:hypothetical protein